MILCYVNEYYVGNLPTFLLLCLEKYTLKPGLMKEKKIVIVSHKISDRFLHDPTTAKRINDGGESSTP